MRVSFRVNRFEDLLRWVLGWGRHARVLHPPELVERVREETREMARAYGGTAKGMPVAGS